MTHLTLAALVLAAAATAAPEQPAIPEQAKPAVKAVKAATEPPAAPAPPAKASKEALQDAIDALLNPCGPDLSDGKVTGASVVDAKALNALIAKEKLNLPKAKPFQLFLAVEYDQGGTRGKDYRQITTSHQLTTEQAQDLIGAKVCVFSRLPLPPAPAAPPKKK